MIRSLRAPERPAPTAADSSRRPEHPGVFPAQRAGGVIHRSAFPSPSRVGGRRSIFRFPAWDSLVFPRFRPDFASLTPVSPDLPRPSATARHTPRLLTRDLPDADDPPTRPPRPKTGRSGHRFAGAPAVSPAPGRVRPGLHGQPEEAELGASESGPRAPHERDRGHHLHTGRRPQPAGALDRAHSRRPGEGSSGRSLPCDSRRPRCGGSGRSDECAFQVRNPPPEELIFAAPTEAAPTKPVRELSQQAALRS